MSAPRHHSSCRVNTGGNFCGHNPLEPKLTLRDVKKKSPLIFRLACERLDNWYSNPLVLPFLNFANCSDRQQRTERREACNLMLKAMVQRMDLVSMRVGYPTADGFVNFTVKYLAKITELPLNRIERAFRDIKASGYVQTKQIAEEQTDGSYKGVAAVKCFTKDLFIALGLGNMLEKERVKATARFKEKMNGWAEKLVGKAKKIGKKIDLSALVLKLQKQYMTAKKKNEKKEKINCTSPPT